MFNDRSELSTQANRLKAVIIAKKLSVVKTQLLETFFDYYQQVATERSLVSFMVTPFVERGKDLTALMTLAEQEPNDEKFLNSCNLYCEQAFRAESKSKLKSMLVVKIRSLLEELHTHQQLIFTILAWDAFERQTPIQDGEFAQLRWAINWEPVLEYRELAAALKSFKWKERLADIPANLREPSSIITRMVAGQAGGMSEAQRFLALSLVIAIKHNRLLHKILAANLPIVGLCDANHGSLAHIALLMNNYDLCHELVTKYEFNLQAVDRNGKTILHHLCKIPNINEGILKLVDTISTMAPTTLGMKDHQGNTPLHLACMSESSSTVEKNSLLLDLNSVANNTGRKAQLALVELLLARGSSVDTVNGQQLKPLYLTSNPEILALLKRSKAPLDSTAFFRRINSAERLPHAAYYWLLENGLDLKQDPFQGYVLLLKAMPNLELTRRLLAAGATMLPNAAIRQLINEQNEDAAAIPEVLGLMNNGSAKGWNHSALAYLTFHANDSSLPVIELLLENRATVDFDFTSEQHLGTKPLVLRVLAAAKRAGAFQHGPAIRGAESALPELHSSRHQPQVSCSTADKDAIVQSLVEYSNKPLSFWRHNNDKAANELITRIRALNTLGEIKTLLKTKLAEYTDTVESGAINSGYYTALNTALTMLRQIEIGQRTTYPRAV